MKIHRTLILVLCLAISLPTFSLAQDIDTELAALTEKLAKPISAHSRKKIAVIDFTDLQGGPSGELGKYIAEQLTVDFVMNKRDFAVLERANLKSILAEHKLTSTGVIDPDNAKKIGMFAGVDALIVGTITPKGQTINVTAKIITTDSAEIIGAAKASFKADSTVNDLIAKPVTDAKAVDQGDESAQVSKVFGDARIEVQSLGIVNGKELEMTLKIINKNPKKSIWFALNTDDGYHLRTVLTDTNGSQFPGNNLSLSGIPAGIQFQTIVGTHLDTKTRFNPAIEIQPTESVTGSFKFYSPQARIPEPGKYRLQMEILVGHNFTPNAGIGAVHNLIANVEAK